ncbi:hypothetical protein SCP_0902340 [Sparassis crispa]|uniref:Chromo domain-containing protein n=1 Tax=Sparassis crispa TaxID=139825 RepID=A0A401GVV8_9APHY|nr:hypothetical protein SCP_0902340 [Sparassis crispa]GBE86355.1 hypothetical protein SCP_0902340 [Sparassis crispa]
MARTRPQSFQSAPRKRPAPRSSTAFMEGRKAVPPPKSVTIAGKKLPISPVLDTLFHFLAERHRIHQRRIAGDPSPWTRDPILAAYPFTNIFRVYDRTTQYILRHVIQEGSSDLHESCFRVMLFRFFNKVETWELLESSLGKVTWRDFSVRKYEEVLFSAEEALYCPAYIIPAPKLGAKANLSNHLRLVQLMMENDLPGHLEKVHHLKDAHGYLRLYPSMGDFTALQLLLDLNMLPHFNFSEDEWVALGPGALECIRKIFGPSVRGSEGEALTWLHSTQYSHFARMGITPDRIPRLCDSRPAGLTKVDFEHALCEVEKYSRAKHPHIVGRRRNVAKSAFSPKREPLTATLPKHWLKPRHAPTTLSRPPPIKKGGSEEYEVSHIIAERQAGQGYQYLVRWVGYGLEDDTWEPESALEHTANLDEWKVTKIKIWDGVGDFQAMGNNFTRTRGFYTAK